MRTEKVTEYRHLNAFHDWQAMNFSGLCAIFTACFKLPASAGALFVNAATDITAHFADECYTMHRLDFRTFHADMVRADCGGQFCWHRALLMRAAFSPVKGNTKRGAAGAAFYTF